MKKRILVVRFAFEANAFSHRTTTLEDFKRYEWLTGDDGLECMRGTATELGGVIDFVESHQDCEAILLQSASAHPSGPFDDAITRIFLDRIRDFAEMDPRAGSIQAVYLSLHGAAVATHAFEPELMIAKEVREFFPRALIGASFDLHGNISEGWAQVVDIASSYRTYPHVDIYETSQRVLEMMHRSLVGEVSPRIVVRNTRVGLPSTNMKTTTGPMTKIQGMARELTSGPLLDISVLGGFPYADSPCAGSAIIVVLDASHPIAGDRASEVVAQLEQCIIEHEPEFRVVPISPQEAVKRATSLVRDGLVAISESSDNPLSGGNSDSTQLFRELVDLNPDFPCLYAAFASERNLALALDAGEGAIVVMEVGGETLPEYGPPVRIKAKVRRITDGNFKNTGRLQTGVSRSYGNTALLEVAENPNIQFIISATPVSMDDPAFFAMHAVDFGTLRLLCVKGKNHFREAFVGVYKHVLDCDCPGPATANLASLPFKHPHIAQRYVALGVNWLV